MGDEGSSKGQPRLPRALLLGLCLAVLIGGGALILLTRSPSLSSDRAPSQSSKAETPAGSIPATTLPEAREELATPASSNGDGAITASAETNALSFADETLTYSLVLPYTPANDPVVAHLRNEGQSYLASKQAEARKAYEIFKKDRTGSPTFPWELMITWAYTAKAGDIVSLLGVAYEFTGGAHGMTSFDTRIARKNGQEIQLNQLLSGGLSPVMVIALCEALKKAKIERINAPTVFDEPIVCTGPNENVKLDRTKFALAPSDQPGRFGGLYAYYGPYEVGPYAEGAYTLVIQQEVFAQDIAAEFKPLFAGIAPPPKN